MKTKWLDGSAISLLTLTILAKWFTTNARKNTYSPGLATWGRAPPIQKREVLVGPRLNFQRKKVKNMKYMLLIYMIEDAMTDAERETCYRESAQLTQELNARGHYLAASPLQPIATATSVRVRDGKSLVTDGPFAETREHLGGYFLIDAPNLDEAIKIAARIPAARKGTVEIRPILEIPGLPPGSK
jgi:hypothetical protein